LNGLDLSPLGILSVLLQVLIILFSLSVHESAHAWTADKLGDPTARMLGRITLNPLPHMDILGTLILPLAMALMGGPIFGWAKPVPVISRNFKHIRRDEALVGIAGPISNLLLCAAATVALGIWMAATSPATLSAQLQTPYTGPWWVLRLAFLNLVLAAFNLIPIPPLDGSWVLSALLPFGVHRFYEEIRRFGPFLLLLLFFTPILSIILTPMLTIMEGVMIDIPLRLLSAALGG